MISLSATFYKLDFCQTQRDRHNLGFSPELRIREKFLHVDLLLPFILIDTKVLVLCVLKMIISCHSSTQLAFYACLINRLLLLEEEAK